MKNVVLFATILLSINAYANSAKIVATDSNNKKKVEIAQDLKGTPRNNGNPKTYPTIKDFGQGSEYVKFCYVGIKKDVKELLESLVKAADGDGDSYAELKSIKVDAKSVYTVTINLTDESGESEVDYTFKPCK